MATLIHRVVKQIFFLLYIIIYRFLLKISETKVLVSRVTFHCDNTYCCILCAQVVLRTAWLLVADAFRCSTITLWEPKFSSAAGEQKLLVAGRNAKWIKLSQFANQVSFTWHCYTPFWRQDVIFCQSKCKYIHELLLFQFIYW